MVRRSLGGMLWSVAGLLACSLGILSALVGTGAGRSLLATSARGVVDRAVAGHIEVGGVEGPLLTGLTLTDVVIYDPDSTLVARLPRAEFVYNPVDLLAGRAVLRGLTLERPQINLVQHASGRLNIEELPHLGEPSRGPRGPTPLVVFRNVRIDEGTVVLKLQTHQAGRERDSTHIIEAAGRDGHWRVRHFDHLTARLAAMRLSAPRQRGVRLDVMSLAVVGSDPPVRLTDLAGRVSIVGASLEADVRRLRMPRSQLS